MRALAITVLAACVEPHGEPCTTCLSSEGLYSDPATKQIAANAIAYTPGYEAWSDGADKQRWLVLPDGAQIDTTDLDHWKFPVGTKVFKEFSLAGTRLETRVIETLADTGDVEADHRVAAYVWRADGSDADLAPDDGALGVLGTSHDVPPREQCMFCHHSEPGAVLGFSAVQLSGPTASPTLAHAAPLLSAPPSTTFPIPGDATQVAALGFLHANCGHCHADEGSCPPPRFRMYTADAAHAATATTAYATTVNVPIAGWPTHPSDITVRIAPGDPDHSAVYYRASQRGTVDQMPPIATNVVPDAGVAELRAWIAGMP